jgi:hypothetical protein
MQFYQPRLTGHREHHLHTLVALLCGLAGGQRAQLATSADHVPSGAADQERVIARFRRWLKQDAHTLEGWCLSAAISVRCSEHEVGWIRGYVLHGTPLRATSFGRP